MHWPETGIGSRVGNNNAELSVVDTAGHRHTHTHTHWGTLEISFMKTLNKYNNQIRLSATAASAEAETQNKEPETDATDVVDVFVIVGFVCPSVCRGLQDSWGMFERNNCRQ